MSKITPRNEDFPQWYLDVVRECDLAELSDVPGCMVIKPRGYAIWESMRFVLDEMFRKTGHRNAYFPLFIPKSYLAKEAKHIAGFAKECAVVTHRRLKVENGELIVDPDAKLTEELVVRPTSETIIWRTYRNWIHSYRDLPLLINQWANVVRWEMRTRMFLRTSEFLWQEGHTAHRTSEEAEAEAVQMINVYRTFAEDYLAIPVIVGKKSPSETFAGANHSYTIEAMLQDKKALQAGTSHNLGTTFGNAFDVQFVDSDGQRKPVWATSWGVSTRLIGALIMSHSDDRGLVLPPKIAPIQVVIIPIGVSEADRNKTRDVSKAISNGLTAKGCRVEIDDREGKGPGWRFIDADLAGIPVRIEVGPKDLAADTVVMVRRDTGAKCPIPLSNVEAEVVSCLTDVQRGLLEKARAFREANTRNIETPDELIAYLDSGGGFACAYLDLTQDTDVKIAELKSRASKNKSLGASVRCIISSDDSPGKCLITGNVTSTKAIIAKAY